jgi:2-polyprenyl-3-methyl-5-hydroxy-6-metoxy-1,4-benzoquinol methylase
MKMIFSDQGKCPLCECGKGQNILKLKSAVFDNSTLYEEIRVYSCDHCGHVYNALTKEEIEGLFKYYTMEYAPANISGSSDLKDLPGSNGLLSQERYSHLFELLSKYITKESTILDIGCAEGGFLRFLQSRGYQKLWGIDLSDIYVEKAGKYRGLTVRKGSSDDIPFPDGTFDVVVIDQVLEHLTNLSATMKEILRVLKHDGVVCVSVPNALQYDEYSFFDFYWFLLKEHVQHFDVVHLRYLFEKFGLVLLETSLATHKMLGNVAKLPSLAAIFKAHGVDKIPKVSPDHFSLTRVLEQYIKKSFNISNKRKKIIERLAIEKIPVFCWGIGREFFYLYYNVPLDRCNVIALIDKNNFKRDKLTFKGKSLSSPEVLKNSSSDTGLIITAFAYEQEIEEEAKQLGFKGSIIRWQGKES